MLTPSIRANRMPPIIAEPTIANGPPEGVKRERSEGRQNSVGGARARGKGHSLRAASTAPVTAPLVIEFQGSSVPRRCTRPQSTVENRHPHTAKLPVWGQKLN